MDHRELKVIGLGKTLSPTIWVMGVLVKFKNHSGGEYDGVFVQGHVLAEV